MTSFSPGSSSWPGLRRGLTVTRDRGNLDRAGVGEAGVTASPDFRSRIALLWPPGGYEPRPAAAKVRVTSHRTKDSRGRLRVRVGGSPGSDGGRAP